MKPTVTVTISGPQGSGKSKIESLLLDALLNAGASGFGSSLSTVTGEETHRVNYAGSDFLITTKQAA